MGLIIPRDPRAPGSRAARVALFATVALLPAALLFALGARRPAEAGAKTALERSAKQATKAAIAERGLEQVKLSCRYIGKKRDQGVRCRWVAAERRGADTFSCRGTGELRSPTATLKFRRSGCKKDRGGTRLTRTAPDRLAKKGLEATDVFCWGNLGRGFACRYEAIRFAERTYACSGTAVQQGKRFKLRRRSCLVDGPATEAQGSVAGALAQRELTPAGVKCRRAGAGWRCDWRATQSSAGRTYNCTGAATAAGPQGPFAVDGCRLRAPDRSPIGSPNPELMFGVNEFWGGMTGEIGRVAALGGDTLRVTLTWASVEHKPGGDYYWDYYDKLYARMLAKGQRPLFVVMGAPCWAAGKPSCSTGEPTNPPAPAYQGAWRDFVAAAAARYGQAAGIEVWNEPNARIFFDDGPDPARYATLLKLARQGLDSVDSDLPLVFAGLAPYTKNRGGEMRYELFLRRALENGAAKAIDAVGHHSYSGRKLRDGHTDGLREQLADLKDVMLDFGIRDLPLWITETGVSTAAKKVSQKKQAKTLARAYKTLRKTPGVEAVIVHRWRDQKGKGLESGYGLTTRKGKAKKALCKLAAARGKRCPK